MPGQWLDRHCLNVGRRIVTAIPVESPGPRAARPEGVHRLPAGKRIKSRERQFQHDPGPERTSCAVDVLSFDGRRVHVRQQHRRIAVLDTQQHQRKAATGLSAESVH
jgi:hypothetical protein